MRRSLFSLPDGGRRYAPSMRSRLLLKTCWSPLRWMTRAAATLPGQRCGGAGAGPGDRDASLESSFDGSAALQVNMTRLRRARRRRSPTTCAARSELFRPVDHAGPGDPDRARPEASEVLHTLPRLPPKHAFFRNSVQYFARRRAERRSQYRGRSAARRRPSTDPTRWGRGAGRHAG